MSRSLSEITRREERIFVHFPVILQDFQLGARIGHGATINYSERGLRVRSTYPFEIGQEIGVAAWREEALPRNYRVVWFRPSQGGESACEAGLELLQEPLI